MALHEHVRRRALRVLVAVAVLMPTIASTAARADGQVAVNGVTVPKASSTIDASQDVTEFREGGSSVIQLLPGLKRYAVCLVAPAPIATFDAELPITDTPSRFTITVEDGREFGQCLLASLNASGSGGKRRLSYCLRCENATTP